MRSSGIQRPTKTVAWWDGCEILGGRDELAGGTWLACSRQGRISFLTNVLKLHPLPEAKSRGDLPVFFLEESGMPFFEFVQVYLIKAVYEFNASLLFLSAKTPMEFAEQLVRGSSIQWI